MFRDNTLIPSEAVRLLALGILMARPLPYDALAAQVRHFSQRIVGPSLDLLGVPIEVLKIEGLIGETEGQNEAPLSLTEEGQAEFFRLMASGLRAPMNDLSKLILAIKVRFLHLLDEEARLVQLDAMEEMWEREEIRLADLLTHHDAATGVLDDYLTLELTQTRERLAWVRRQAGQTS